MTDIKNSDNLGPLVSGWWDWEMRRLRRRQGGGFAAHACARCASGPRERKCPGTETPHAVLSAALYAADEPRDRTEGSGGDTGGGTSRPGGEPGHALQDTEGQGRGVLAVRVSSRSLEQDGLVGKETWVWP